MDEETSALRKVDPGLRDFARDQRRSATKAEAALWEQLRAGRFNGIKVKRQVPIAPYIADFLCASARIVIELDGPPHDDESRRRRDATRDAWLRRQGFQVLRFPNDLALSNMGAVLDAIGKAIESRGKNPPPSAGEGGRGAAGRGDRDLSGESSAPLSRPSLTRGQPSPAEGGGL